jgi:hypothetical protein
MIDPRSEFLGIVQAPLAQMAKRTARPIVQQLVGQTVATKLDTRLRGYDEDSQPFAPSRLCVMPFRFFVSL